MISFIHVINSSYTVLTVCMKSFGRARSPIWPDILHVSRALHNNHNRKQA